MHSCLYFNEKGKVQMINRTVWFWGNPFHKNEDTQSRAISQIFIIPSNTCAEITWFICNSSFTFYRKGEQKATFVSKSKRWGRIDINTNFFGKNKEANKQISRKLSKTGLLQINERVRSNLCSLDYVHLLKLFVVWQQFICLERKIRIPLFAFWCFSFRFGTSSMWNNKSLRRRQEEYLCVFEWLQLPRQRSMLKCVVSTSWHMLLLKAASPVKQSSQTCAALWSLPGERTCLFLFLLQKSMNPYLNWTPQRPVTLIGGC